MNASLREKLDQFDATLPLSRARTIPNFWYTDREIYDAECRAVFAESWQMIARADQLQAHGSFVTADIAGEPIAVVRTVGHDSSDLIAFYNVCRHRAARVATEPSGRATRFRCPYHGWTYDLTGRLIGTPEFEGVDDFCKTDHGLVPVAAARWGPLVWVSLNSSRLPLNEFLAPLPGHASSAGIESLRFARRTEYTLNCNWKVFVDNYLDGGYHVNSVHPGLAGVLDYSEYRTDIARKTAVQSSPLRPPSADSPVGLVRTGDTAYYWWIYPNFMLNIYAGVMDTNLVLPLGPDRCRVIFDYYFATTEGHDACEFIERSIEVADRIQQEDVSICEQVQAGLVSRSYCTGRFSVRREAAGYHFHKLLASDLRRAVELPNAPTCGAVQ